MFVLGNGFDFTFIKVAAPNKIINGQHDRLLTCLLIKASKKNGGTALLLVWVVVSLGTHQKRHTYCRRQITPFVKKIKHQSKLGCLMAKYFLTH
jgi:hypothetical protein